MSTYDETSLDRIPPTCRSVRASLQVEIAILNGLLHDWHAAAVISSDAYTEVMAVTDRMWQLATCPLDHSEPPPRTAGTAAEEPLATCPVRKRR